MPDPEQAPPPGEGVTSPSDINSLPIPEQFDNTLGHCNQAKRWAKWYRRFQRYRYALGLGYLIDASGRHADPDKTSTITEFPAPTNLTELQRFMGTVNQLGKFVPSLADLTEPMRELMRKESAWYLGQIKIDLSRKSKKS